MAQAKCSKVIPRWARAVLPALFWLAVWQLAYIRVGKDLLLASPWQTMSAVWRIISAAASWHAIGRSLLRMLCAFAIGVGCGSAIAALTASVGWADALLRPALAAVRATPVASFIILALVWMSSGTVPVFAASLMALPIVWGNLTQGIAAVDRGLLEMAAAYQFGAMKTVRHVILPSVRGTFIAACGASIGLCWKAMIAAEVLGAPRGAIGTQLYNAKIYLQTDELFAWTLIVILLSRVLEAAFGKVTKGTT